MLKVGTSSRHIANRSNGSTLTAQALAVLKSFGSNAHLYLPGVGMVNGITAGNYLDSAGTTAATVDGLVGLVTDSLGAVNASQSTGANRPTERRGIVNLAAKSADFSGVSASVTSSDAWYVNNMATVIASSGVTDQNGGSTAGTFNLADATNPVFYQYKTGMTASAIYTIAFWVKSSASGGASNTRLTTNNHFGWNTGISQKFSLTNQYQLLVVSGAVTNGTSLNFGVDCRDATGTVDATCTGKVDVCFAGLFTGTLTAAQILAAGGIPLTTTTAASSTAGNYALQFNGSSNYLSLSAPLFQMSDDHAVIAGARCDANTAVYEIFTQRNTGSTNAIAPVIRFDGAGGSVIRALWRDDAGTLTSSTQSGTYSIGSAYVVSARKLSNNKRVRVNGVDGTLDTTALGATTLVTASIGVSASTSNTNYLIGSTYPVIAINGTLSDSGLLTLERWVASLTGPVSGMVVF